MILCENLPGVTRLTLLIQKYINMRSIARCNFHFFKKKTWVWTI
jgi:hypothetical protein